MYIREQRINETIDNDSCLSKIKVEPSSIQISKRFKVNSDLKFKTSTRIDECSQSNSFETEPIRMRSMSQHERFHMGEKRYSCDVVEMLIFPTKKTMSALIVYSN